MTATCCRGDLVTRLAETSWNIFTGFPSSASAGAVRTFARTLTRLRRLLDLRSEIASKRDKCAQRQWLTECVLRDACAQSELLATGEVRVNDHVQVRPSRFARSIHSPLAR